MVRWRVFYAERPIRGTTSSRSCPRRAPFGTSSGLKVAPDRSTADCRGAVDTLLAAGGTGVREAARDEPLVGWLRSAAGRSRRVASVCTGAFLLGAAGLLEGRRVTTHWAWAERFAHDHPGVEVEPDRIFVRDGEVWTSAGVTAGLAAGGVRAPPGRPVPVRAPLAAQSAERGPLRRSRTRCWPTRPAIYP